MSRKAQAATEFLMTYGWTILIIMIVIGLLFALGVFDIKTPNTCYTPEPYKCLDVKASGTTVSFLISASGVDGSANNAIDVTDPEPKNIRVNGKDCPDGAPVDFSLSTAEDAAKIVTCTLAPTDALNKGNKFEGTIALQYKKYGGNIHSVSGAFAGTAE